MSTSRKIIYWIVCIPQKLCMRASAEPPAKFRSDMVIHIFMDAISRSNYVPVCQDITLIGSVAPISGPIHPFYKHRPLLLL